MQNNQPKKEQRANCDQCKTENHNNRPSNEQSETKDKKQTRQNENDSVH